MHNFSLRSHVGTMSPKIVLRSYFSTGLETVPKRSHHLLNNWDSCSFPATNTANTQMRLNLSGRPVPWPPYRVAGGRWLARLEFAVECNPVGCQNSWLALLVLTVVRLSGPATTILFGRCPRFHKTTKKTMDFWRYIWGEPASPHTTAPGHVVPYNILVKHMGTNNHSVAQYSTVLCRQPPPVCRYNITGHARS